MWPFLGNNYLYFYQILPKKLKDSRKDVKWQLSTILIIQDGDSLVSVDHPPEAACQIVHYSSVNAHFANLA